MSSDDRVTPDDITEEERKAAIPARREWLAAQNALRDRRVREDERERLADILEAMADRQHDRGAHEGGANFGFCAATVRRSESPLDRAIREGGQHGE